MKHTPVCMLLVMLMAAVSGQALAADRKDSLNTSVVIDRSVLEDLKGYKPPPMFAPGASAAPLARKVLPPETASLLIVPKAEDVLEFPVQNSEVITRQRMTDPEDHVAMARPDYSDSHTTLDMKHPAVKAKKDKEDVAATSRKVKAAKAPLPPRKPSVQLASAGAEDIVIVREKESSAPAKTEPAAGKTDIGLGNVDDLPLPAPMRKADPAPKYVPNSRPSMPVVTSGKVERAQLDAFGLPLEDEDTAKNSATKPTPGERMIDAALNSRMVDAKRDDIQTAMEGGKVSENAPLVKTAAVSAGKGIQKSGQVMIEFKPRLTNLQSSQEESLRTEVLPRLKANPEERLQIQAYASHNSNEESEARRLSLARALAVRAFLLENGIEASRMDVRALGSNTTGAVSDRVDLVFLSQG